ncbi:MAG: hypothetical protein E7376_03280 [Clostridiales bacterium]|nr:hypothetical protein [Clostridiales bacterium]
MKKFSFLILSIMLICTGVLFSACGENPNNASITLSSTNVSIYLGETENNSVIINAKPNEISVDALTLFYDPSYINVSQSEKLSDGSFNLTIKSKVEIGTTNPIEVVVSAGNSVSETFFVEIILPVESIVADENVYMAYNGVEARYNLLNAITFEPSGTKQTGVEFTLAEENDYISIDGNYLVVAQNANLNFGTGASVRVNATSTVEGKSAVSTSFDVAILPNAALLAENIEVFVDYNNAVNAIEDKNYELTITKTDDGYELSTFVLIVKLPTSLGLQVDLDASFAPNILDYLSYSKSITSEGLKDVYTFTFEASTSMQGEGDLYLKYSYKNVQDNSLSANFICQKTEGGIKSLIKKVHISALMPITEIQVNTDAELSNTGSYTIFRNYNQVNGTMFVFNALPLGTIQKELCLVKSAESQLEIYNSKGELLEFVDNKCNITSGDVLYIKGGEKQADSLQCISATEGKESISLTIFFNVIDGASSLGFVATTESTDAKDETTLFTEVTQPITAYIYAPGVEDVTNFIADTGVVISSLAGINGYFVAEFIEDTVGSFNYTIATANGFSIIAHVNAIETVKEVNLDLKTQAEYTSGVGDANYESENLINLSLQAGYSVELDYIVNSNAQITSIAYSFYEPNVNVYNNDEINALKNVTAPTYDNDKTFIATSSIVNTQNLTINNLITGTRTGIVIVKIQIYGYKAENGTISIELKDTKYLFVEVYNPVKEVKGSAKNISLRAQDQVDTSLYYNLTTQTINFNVLSVSEQLATYNRLFIDGGLFTYKTLEDGTKIYSNTYKIVNRYDQEQDLFTATYDYLTNNLKIEVLHADELVAGTYQIILFAADFANFVATEEGIYTSIGDVENYVTYVVNLTILDTKLMTNISVSNLKVENEDQTTKTYETIYFDTSKSNNLVYKLQTLVEPIDAFDKNLTFTYIPNSGSTQAMVDVAQDGTITVLGDQGGSGRIEITPKYAQGINVKTVIIPIVVADGNSWKTAYQITSLNEIINPNKHYVLTIPTTYIASKTLFDTFSGGLYGRTYEGALAHDPAPMATIHVQGNSLFNTLASGAHVEDLYICGDITAKVVEVDANNDGIMESVEINRGFVASTAQNNSVVSNVKVTTFVSGEVYVPSTITVNAGVTASIGGLVGTNNGEVKGCKFAGSINIAANSSAIAQPIVGSGNVPSDCVVITAKFDAKLKNSGRVLKNGDYYINGLITSTDNNGTAFALSAGVTVEHYSNYEFTEGKISIKDYKNGGYQSSFGQTDSNFGIVFYYEAVENSKETAEILNQYNTIKLSYLLSIDTVTAISVNNLKVVALNADNTICDFVVVSTDSITIKGVGEFKLVVTSEYDYTKPYELNILSLYYMSDFEIDYNGSKLNGDTLNIVANQTREIVSSVNSTIKVINLLNQEQIIELCKNDFNVIFTFANGEDSTMFITNNKIGSHTINMTDAWNWELTSVEVTLDVAGYSDSFNELLNKYLSATETYVAQFNIDKKLGTKGIEANVSEGSVEPNDYFSFEVVLDTDTTSDEVTADTVQVLTQGGYPASEGYFSVVVDKLDKNQNGNVDDDVTFKVTINVNYDTLSTAQLLSLVNRKYNIIVKAKSDASATEVTYDAFATIALTVLPQTIANINTTLYKVTSSTPNGVSVTSAEIPTSVILPSEYGFMVIDMFPSYASYEYLEIVATSNTMSKLSFRLQEKDLALGATHYKTAVSGYEALENKNGIRILNSGSGDAQSIGRYYVKLFVGATFDADTIFTITVNAYYNAQKLTAQSVFTLYVRAPEAPQLSLNGETRVYSLAGQDVTGITVLIADDQINSRAYIATQADGTSVLDSRPIGENIKPILTQVYDNVEQGYKRYTIKIDFTDEYNIATDSLKIKLVVESTKISNGKQVKVSSEMYIYVVEYLPKEDDIVIWDTRSDIFDVTSLKAVELKLAPLVNVAATENFVQLFDNNYYFENNDNGFKFGSNSAIFGNEAITFENKAYVLASYLSYVNGDTKTPLLIRDADGNLQFNNHDYCNFRIVEKEQTNEEGYNYTTYHLYVQGGDYTGSVQMILEIPYHMPDGRIFTYEYKFEILNSIYTTEDLPTEIANSEDFLAISNQDLAKDYILTNDLNLYDFSIIANTDKISSLDGNNHTINIRSFAEIQNGSANFALFNQISANTTIKNLTVNLYYLSEIQVASTVSDVKVAGFAIQNNGVISNCEVSVYKASKDAVTSTIYGIKLNEEIDAEVAGFVLNNYGSITNSRVGSDSKLITNIEYFVDEKTGFIDNEKTKITSHNESTKAFTIKASGTISGFVGTNSGVIASSFVKNINIKNTYYKQETRITSGFVNTNSGTIALSYAQGAFANATDIQASVGGLEGSGIISGFVYLNTNKITDSYSNLMITNTRDQVGRLGAGFVFENTESATIEHCYSASKIVSNNITQMNFAGIKDFGGYNNSGVIKTSYYYTKESTDVISIESVLNTSITAVSDFTYMNNFYGFSFEKTTESTTSKSVTKGTWKMTNHGPQLVSANDIAHSLREKYEVIDAAESEVPYYFVYSEGFELGSVNNPIIIRNAEEFNKVFGGSTSTEVKKNFDLATAKVFGAYRIVNNIDMLELVPKEEQETEFKVNLLSTNMTLTGEETNSSGRNGSLDGNGLTISNLAISNASTTGDNFGLFKTIENNASISNLNIELASGGVSADHTTFVGTLAGSLIDSWAYNIKISAIDTSDYTQVIGANITGGAFGLVSGSSTVSSINLENISATSTFNTTKSFGVADLETECTTINAYTRFGTNNTQLSIAGGVFGVLDIYTLEELQGGEEYGATEYLAANVLSISVQGGLKVEGMTVGGIAGYIGKYVVARDLHLTVMKDELPVKLTAYSCFAGGIAGYSEGSLYQVRAEHEQTWQTEIESNINKYYKAESAEARAAIDRGQLDIFKSDIGYKPFVVGGLIGVARTGRLSIAYSKINVISELANYAGGAIGVVCSPGVGSTDESIKINEVYVVGDVYSQIGESYIVGGLIAYMCDTTQQISRFNAMNYWSFEAYNKFKDDKSKEAIGITQNSINAKWNGTGASTNFELISSYSVSKLQFEGEGDVIELDNSAEIMTSYYSYAGVESDNGAQIDLMFREKEWYLDGNWSRDVSEMFPHILFVTPDLTFTIASTKDFYKFANYGADPNVTFVVIDMVQCAGWQTTYGLIRASIVGLTNECGFENLRVPLFAELSGTKVSNLKFINNSSALAQKATNTKFSGLVYEGGTFTRSYGGNTAAIVFTINNSATFTNISFIGSKLNVGDVQNAGFLFATTDASGASDGDNAISIENVKFDNATSMLVSSKVVNKKSPAINDFNFGVFFGNSSLPVEIASATFSAKLDVNLYEQDQSEYTSDVIVPQGRVGLFGGYADEISVNLSNVQMSTDNSLKVKLSTDAGTETAGTETTKVYNYNLTLYIGGIVGSSNKLNLIADEDAAALKNIYFAPNITLTGIEKATTLFLGTAAGYVRTLAMQKDNYLYGFGYVPPQNDNQAIYKMFSYSPAAATSNDTSGVKGVNYIGGICGQIAQLDIAANSYVAYYGDMVVSSDQVADIQLFIGGCYGLVDTTDQNAVISNSYFEGTMSFKGKAFARKIENNVSEESEDDDGGSETPTEDTIVDNITMHAGGLIGHIGGLNTSDTVSGELTIKNSIASGDLLLTYTTAEGNYEVNLNSDSYIGGLFGYSDSNIYFGTELQEGTPSEQDGVTVLTTLFATAIYNNVDAIGSFADGCYGKINKYMAEGTTTKTDKLQYTSTLTFSVSNNNKFKDADNNDCIPSNNTYDQVFAASNILTVIGGNSAKGSKVNPYDTSPTSLSQLQSKNDSQQGFYKTDNEQNSYKVTFESTYIRKLYVKVAESVGTVANILEQQISLKNTIMFSDGAPLYSYVTPFDTINADSAVSGVVAKVHIDVNLDESVPDRDVVFDESAKINNNAGFANENKGIIYTCSVQENFDELLQNGNAIFEAYLRLNEAYTINDAEALFGGRIDDSYVGRVAGFVAFNIGKIFGSNANINIGYITSDLEIISPVKVASFVGYNFGDIQYSYVSGTNRGYENSATGNKMKDVKASDWFAPKTVLNIDTETGTSQEPQGNIDNCYTITKMKGGLLDDLKVDIDSTSDTDIYFEADGCEVNATGSTDIYGSIDTSVLGDYFAVHKDYNNNYPTLSNGPFVNFIYLKRSSYVAYNKDIANYEAIDSTIVRNTGATLTNADYLFKGIEYLDNNNKTVIWYYTIPNLTILKKLYVEDTATATLDSNASLLAYCSKFVITADINVGYTCTTADSYINQTYVKDLGNYVTHPDASSPKPGLIVDGYNYSLDNVYLKECNLFGTVGNNGEANPILVHRIKFTNVKLNNTDGIIGLIDSSATVTNVSFITSIADNGILISPYTGNNEAESKSTTIGVLAGENKGIISYCSLTSLIYTPGTAIVPYTLGGLVGKNSGQISDCSLSSTVAIAENNLQLQSSTEADCQETTLVFGGIAGENTGTINNCQLKVGQSINYALTGGGTIYSNKTESETSGYYSQISISTLPEDIEEEISTLSAQIYVSSKGIAFIGGIVGKATSGTISKSFTNEAVIYGGNENCQIASYVGGIAGSVEGATLVDCSNMANVGAMAVWLFTQKDETKAAYKIVDGIVTKIQNVEVDSKNGILNSDANITPVVKYDGDKIMHAYREMSSLAFAGGIAGAGLISAEATEGEPSTAVLNNGSEKLINSGTIIGGYRAIKPVAKITATPEEGKFDAYSDWLTGLISGVIGSAIAIATLPFVQKWIAGFVPWGIAAAAAIGVTIKILKVLQKLAILTINNLIMFGAVPEMESITLKTKGLYGNSTDYYGSCEVVSLIFNSDGYSGSVVNYFNNAILNKATYPYTGMSSSTTWDYNSDPLDSETLQSKGFMTYANKFVGGGLSRLVTTIQTWTTPSDFIGKLINEFLDLEFNNPIKSKETNFAGFRDASSSNKTFNGVEKYVAADGETELKLEDQIGSTGWINGKTRYRYSEYNYDGICPSITTGTEDALKVYSFTSNYNKNESTGKSTLNTVNKFNSHEYSNVTDRYTKTELEDFEDIKDKIVEWGNWSCVDEINKHFEPKDTTELNIEFDLSSEILTYTIESILDWEKIVYTVNSNTKLSKYYSAYPLLQEDYDSLSDSDKLLYNNNLVLVQSIIDKYYNMVITIALKNNEGALGIEVSDDIFNKFNGSITSKQDYKFYNLVLKTGTSTSTGIVKESQGVTLKGITINGNVSIDARPNGTISAGILVGNINDQVKELNITNCTITGNISIVEDTITNASVTNINNLGITIGCANLTEAFNNDIQKVNVNLSNFTINEKNVLTGADKSFGIIIGQLGSGTINIYEVATSGKAQLSSSFNKVGTFAGEVAVYGTLNTLSSNDLKMSLIASANADIYVGGYVGYNAGIVNVNSFDTIGLNAQTIISADVINSAYKAYAAGIIGGNIGTLNGSGSLSLGSSLETGYAKVDYIFAGYNMVNLENAVTAFPKEAHVDFITNNISGSYNSGIMVTNYNLVMKYIQEPVRDANWPNSSLVGSKTYVQWTDYSSVKVTEEGGSAQLNFADYISIQTVDGKPTLVVNQEKKYNNASSEVSEGGMTVKTKNKLYRVTTDNAGETNDIYSEVIENSVTYKKTVKLSYSYQDISKDEYVSSKLDGVIEQQKIFYINYYEYEEAYGDALTKGALSRTYKLLVRLVNTNAKLDDEGRYTLQIIQLNDYLVDEESVEVKLIAGTYVEYYGDASGSQIAGVREVSDINSSAPGYQGKLTILTDSETGAPQTAQYSEYYEIKTYQEVQNVNKVIYSKTFNLSDRLDDTFDNPYGVSLSASKTNDIGELDESTTQVDIQMELATIKSKGFKISVSESGLKLSEQYDLSVEKNSSTIDVTTESSTTTVTTEYEGTYELELISINSLPVGQTTVNSSTLASRAIDPNDEILQSEYVVTLKDLVNGDETSTSGKYSSSLKINQSIDLPYKDSIFTFNGQQYNRIAVADYTGANGGSYLIVTCLKMEETNRITEFIYKKVGSVFKSCGSIAYTLAQTDATYTMSEVFTQLYMRTDATATDNNNYTRYESFFPNESRLTALNLTISSASDNITQPSASDTGVSKLEFGYYYYNTHTQVLAGYDENTKSPFYQVKTTYKTMFKKITVQQNSNTIDATGIVTTLYPADPSEVTQLVYITSLDSSEDGSETYTTAVNGLFEVQTITASDIIANADGSGNNVALTADDITNKIQTLDEGSYVFMVAAGAGNDYLESALGTLNYNHYYLYATVTTNAAGDKILICHDILGFYYGYTNGEGVITNSWNYTRLTDINNAHSYSDTLEQMPTDNEQNVIFYIITDVNTENLDVAAEVTE